MSDFEKLVNDVAAMCFADAVDVVQMYDEDDKRLGIEPLPDRDRVAYLYDMADTTFVSVFGDEVRAKLEQLCNEHYK